MAPRVCEVCKQSESKYKCPSCFVPYCSLSCFRKHKEIPCKKPLLEEEKPAMTVVKPSTYELKPSTYELKPRHPLSLQKTGQVDEENWILQREKLESIALSEEIRLALKDEELRRLVYNIACSTDADVELDREMKEPRFYEFANKILSITSPQE